MISERKIAIRPGKPRRPTESRITTTITMVAIHWSCGQ